MKIPDDEPDPAFTAKITGGRSLYKDGDSDSFTVRSAYSREAYLTVFWVNSDFEAGVIFPARPWHDNRIGACKEREIRNLVFEMSSKNAKKEAGMVHLRDSLRDRALTPRAVGTLFSSQDAGIGVM